MNKLVDLEYMDDGIFTTFFPNTDEGVDAWNEIAAQTDGTGKVLLIHSNVVIRDLRRAGYTVSRIEKPSKSDVDKFNKDFDAIFGSDTNVMGVCENA